MELNRNGGALSKIAILAWAISAAGAVLWLYGYFATGSPSLIDWRGHTPWWIADFLPDLESELGMTLMCLGTVVIYWPSRR